MQLHVHLKGWTLKFKLLYLWNYISYFDKIHRISCVNTHIQNLKVWLKSLLPRLKYSIFPRGLNFIGAPCTLMQWRHDSWRNFVSRPSTFTPANSGLKCNGKCQLHCLIRLFLVSCGASWGFQTYRFTLIKFTVVLPRRVLKKMECVSLMVQLSNNTSVRLFAADTKTNCSIAYTNNNQYFDAIFTPTHQTGKGFRKNVSQLWLWCCY